MDNKTSASRQILIQDLGILLFLASVTGAALVTALAGEVYLYQNIFMLMALMLSALLTVMRANVAGILTSALAVLGFTIYKLYFRLAYHSVIEPLAYPWPVLMVGAMAGMTMFISLYSTVEGINSLLNRRLDELTVMDTLTGLENHRSMVNTLKRYMALCERNDTEMGLMLIRLRYAEELRKVLSREQFDTLRYTLANTIQNVLRMEDRVFSIDESGSIGVIYFSKVEGAAVVKNRLLHAVSQTDMLPDLNEQLLTVELSIVYRQYRKELGKDALRFVSEVEKEFAYEV